MAKAEQCATSLGVPLEWLKKYCEEGRSLGSAIVHREFRNKIQEFIQANNDPKTSPNYSSKEKDEIRVLVKILRVKDCKSDAEIAVAILETIKILSRKRINRRQLTENDIRGILRFLEEPLNDRVTAVCVNTILNVCYERENVQAIIRGGGPSILVNLLSSSDKEILANACGAIQSVCFQVEGRHSIREAGGIEPLIVHINSSDTKLRSRAAGALHNMSSDVDSIRMIRKGGALPKIVSLLHDENGAISGSAAATLQNMSREIASRKIILDLNAVPGLGELLVGKSVSTKICAAGALLNLIGPMIDNSTDQGKTEFKESELQERKGLCRIMSLCITVSSIIDSVFQE